jgi:hypothetical protein
MKRCFSSPEHENLYRQTPSIWLRRSAGLVAWLWLASVAEALPTYTPIPLDNPNPQADARFAEAVASIGDVNGDGVTDLLVGAPFQILGGNLNQGRVFSLQRRRSKSRPHPRSPVPPGACLVWLRGRRGRGCEPRRPARRLGGGAWPKGGRPRQLGPGLCLERRRWPPPPHPR